MSAVSNQRRFVRISAVFHRLASGSGSGRARHNTRPVSSFAPAACHGRRIQVMARPSVGPRHDRAAGFPARRRASAAARQAGRRKGDCRRRSSSSPAAALLLPAGALSGAVEVTVRTGPALQAVALHQLAQRILAQHADDGINSSVKYPAGALGGEHGHGVEKKCHAGKTNVLIRPKSLSIITGDRWRV
ncbi:MAG: hypothetical protein HS122_02020 [Opitutaceae bacterium]|nr:hypothetical protein [Opitutaceae bacterium]